MMEKEGYPFRFNPEACQSCSGCCCTGESGYIWLEISDIEMISKFLSISFSTMVRQYTQRINGRFSLQERKRKQDDYACVFFDKGCQIYNVRPKQCKTYPFWHRFKRFPKEVKQECPGIEMKQQLPK